MESWDRHDLDEEGEHDEDECEKCLETEGTVTSSCRCAECCKRLLIEVGLRDAEREPRIKELCGPIYDPPELTGTGKKELVGYLLNRVTELDNACVFLDRATDLCTIHATRPLACRVFNCDGADRDELVDLGILPPRFPSTTPDAPTVAAEGK